MMNSFFRCKYKKKMSKQGHLAANKSAQEARIAAFVVKCDASCDVRTRLFALPLQPKTRKSHRYADNFTPE
jgi:hypothetical protein